MPLDFQLVHVTRIGGQLFGIGGGVGCWVMSPRDGGEDWGARVIVTQLFPKH